MNFGNKNPLQPKGEQFPKLQPIVQKVKLILLLVIGLMTSCKKETPPEEFYYQYLSSSLKPYMFKSGSYWVYENDSTGIVDSIVVTATKHDFFILSPTGPGQTGTQTKVEYYKLEIYDVLNVTSYIDFLHGSVVIRNGSESGISYLGQPILLAHSPIGSTSNGAQVWDTISVLNVGSNTFHGVQEMKIIYSEQNQIEFDHDTYLYFADSIGLVKKEIDLGSGNIESWSLKRWSVSF